MTNAPELKNNTFTLNYPVGGSRPAQPPNSNKIMQEIASDQPIYARGFPH